MPHSIKLIGAIAAGIVLGSFCAASAQTAPHRARHAAADGHVIIVHPREPYLTLGTGSSVGAHHAYVLDTLNPPQRNSVQGTFVGVRGSDRLPNQYSLPESNVPLLMLPQIF